MFTLIDKKNKKGYTSKSNKAISDKSGVQYSTLNYWARRGYYENLEYIYCKTEELRSKQGGYRLNAFKKKV